MSDKFPAEQPGRIARLLTISGVVQGVSYRQSTVEAARARDVAGWVRNLPDGSVEAWLEGAPEAVAALIDWCRRGPPHARVDDVAVRDVTPEGLSGELVVRRDRP